MPTALHYKQVAESLAEEVPTGFKSKTETEIREVLRDAMGPDSKAKLGEGARKGLRIALRREGIRVYPPLEEKHDAYRLYRVDDIVAGLVDLIADPSETTDERLEDFLTPEVTAVIMRVRRNRP